jgi:exopolysaccharide biosynthesis WecB/TagA/CpsF family protein
MRNAGKRNILGILINAVDYEGAEEAVIRAARDKRSLSVSAIAVHGLMTGVFDREQKFRLNQFDLLVPDGQPVRWALNWLYRVALRQRVYGPQLTLRVCARAAAEDLPVYFYGSTPEVLRSLCAKLTRRVPDLIIAGAEPSKFRRLMATEKRELAERIRASRAAITFVGLGCPRQEAFVYEFSDLLDMPLLAVGAAFPFIAGVMPQAPLWMQNAGLEWLFRLYSEPKRLWQRYLFLNPIYLLLLALQRIGLSQFPTEGQPPEHELLFG